MQLSKDAHAAQQRKNNRSSTVYFLNSPYMTDKMWMLHEEGQPKGFKSYWCFSVQCDFYMSEPHAPSPSPRSLEGEVCVYVEGG